MKRLSNAVSRESFNFSLKLQIRTTVVHAIIPLSLKSQTSILILRDCVLGHAPVLIITSYYFPEC